MYSNDGSHKYIKNYPDPLKKITLIEKNNFFDYPEHVDIGRGSEEKGKMFIEGSKYVKNDIDVFWCTDMDEFCNSSVIKKVEDLFCNFQHINTIDMEHYAFWKDNNYIFCDYEKETMKFFPRITRHRPNNIYGHCSFNEQYPETYWIDDEKYYHFSYVGRDRVKFKLDFYCIGSEPLTDLYNHYFDNVWDTFDNSIESNEIYGYPNMHPNPDIHYGIKIFNGKFPEYLNIQKMMSKIT